MTAKVQQIRQSILIVDDDLDFRAVMQEALEEDGLLVDVAGDGQQALSQVARRCPAMVVLDWGLPMADGGAFATQLREALDGDIPVLLITADGRAAEKAKETRAFAYLHKPLDVDVLVATVRQGLAAV